MDIIEISALSPEKLAQNKPIMKINSINLPCKVHLLGETEKEWLNCDLEFFFLCKNFVLHAVSSTGWNGKQRVLSAHRVKS